MAIDPFCLFRTLGLCKEPPVEATQPEWWSGLPSGSPQHSLRQQQQQQQQQQQVLLQQTLGQSFDAVDVRETATEVYCMQTAATTAAATYYMPSKQQQQQQQQQPFLSDYTSVHNRAYAPAAAAAAGSYPSSSRSSSNVHVPGFFGDLPLGKGTAAAAAAATAAGDRWGSTEASSSSRGVSNEQRSI